MQVQLPGVLRYLCLLMVACVFSLSTPATYAQRKPKGSVSVVGEYHSGGASILLKRDKTFVVTYASDDRLPVTWIGTYAFQDNHITFNSSTPPDGSRTTIMPDSSKNRNQKTSLPAKSAPSTALPLKSLVVVPWGKRLYLMSDEQVRDFCNDINLGREPRWSFYGSYFARLRSHRVFELEAATGKPLLPAPWGTFLLDNPVTGAITNIEHTGREGKGPLGPGGEIVAITVDGGSRQGLQPGMLLYMHSTPEFAKKYTSNYQYARIKRVTAEECVAEFTTFVPDLPVNIGTAASTRMDMSTVEYYLKGK